MPAKRAAAVALVAALSLPITVACDNEDRRDVEEGVEDAQNEIDEQLDEVEKEIDEADTDGKDD